MKVIQLIFVSILVSLPTFSHQKSNQIGDCLLEDSYDNGNFNITFICYKSAIDKNILSNSTTAECRNSGSFKKDQVAEAKFKVCEMDTLPAAFFVGYSQIKVLDVSHMKLEELTNKAYSVIGSLEKLNASYNNLTAVPTFPSSNSLTELDLSNNYYIKVLNSNSFEHLKHLTHLILSNCALSGLPDDVFMYQEYLQYVDLSQNSLKSIDMNIFLPSFFTLQRIHLNGNEITELIGELPRTLFSQLECLILSNNQINCNSLRDFVNLNELSGIRFSTDTSDDIEYLIYNNFGVCKSEINTTPSNYDADYSYTTEHEQYYNF